MMIPYLKSLRSAQDPVRVYFHRKEALMWGPEGAMVPHAGIWELELLDVACAWSTSLDFSRKTQQVKRNGKQREEIP